MPTSKPAHHTSRTLLLASDCKNTVIAEMAGSIHRLAYSPYGQQSSRQEVMTQVGFRGELREAKIDGYALGNGYRVYNPRLMRFHSPDKSSPFEKGGLNTYMYCGGEPVMNVDPTGRSFWSKLLNIWDFLSLSNTSSGPRRNALPPPTGSGKSGFLNAAGGVLENAEVNKRPPIVSAGGKGRRHAPPSWQGSQGGQHSTTMQRVTTQPGSSALETSRGKVHTGTVLGGNYGVRPQYVHTTVKTQGGLEISGTDSGTRQFPSTSRVDSSRTASEIRHR